jgi:hypothetical protein
MRDLVPQERLGAFFSKRMSLTTALGIPLSLAAGLFLDYWKGLFPSYELYGYSLLFFLGFVAGMLDAYYVSTIPEPRLTPVPGTRSFLQRDRATLRTKLNDDRIREFQPAL